MRSDRMLERKCVHVKLRKAVHTALRHEMLSRGLSIQEVVDRFAEEFIQGKKGAVSIVNRAAAEKIRRQMEPLMPAKKRRRPCGPVIEEVDHDGLYELISEATDADADTDEDEDDV